MNKNWLLTLGIVAICLVSGLGLIDDYSQAYLDEALSTGAIVYATARGINAAVSILQGTELEVFFATISIGEALDPLNDLIERFSGLLLIALGSLAAQKILLEIVSSAFFVVLIAIITIATVGSIWYPPLFAYRNVMLKAFTITVLGRFALTFVVLATGMADQIFFLEKDLTRHENMRNLRDDVQRLSTRKPLAPSEAEMQAISNAIENAKERQDALKREIAPIEVEMTHLQAELDLLYAKQPFGCEYNPLCRPPNAIIQLTREISNKKGYQQILHRQITNVGEQLKDLLEQQSCFYKQQRGENCSWLPITKKEVERQWEKLKARISDFAATVIALLMSMLLKTVLIPLAFLWLWLKFARQVFKGF